MDDGTPDRGYYNWYYGAMANDSYLKPQPALRPLVKTGNLAMSYSDSMVRAWLKDTSPARVRRAARIMARLPDESAVWVRAGDRYRLASPVRRNRMSRTEYRWFRRHAGALVNTSAAPYGPVLIATLVDDTTYSVAGDHGGIQRRSQQIRIVFAGGGVGRRDLRAPARSVDIMPTILRQLRIPATHPLDDRAYRLPRH